MSGLPRRAGSDPHDPSRSAKPRPTPRQAETLATYVAMGGSISRTAARLGIGPSTAKRHLADLRQRADMTTEQLSYTGRAAGWLHVEPLERTAAAIFGRERTA